MNEERLDKQIVYIVGVSGGVDSMALLDMLYKKHYQIVVCHVNYHFRHDSNIDQQLVEQYCKQRKIPCYVKEVSKVEYTKENFQVQAREIRYTFYQEIGTLYHTSEILLAHHQDDVIETIYMQIQRNNTKGYLGIQAISEIKEMVIHRPLLHMNKEQLYQYCNTSSVKYHEDYTNFEAEFTRDYVRNIVLPTFTDKQKQALLTQADAHNQKYLQQEKKMQKRYQEYIKNGYSKYDGLTALELSSLVYFLLKQVVYPPDISNSLVNECIKQIHSKKPNVEVNLPVNAVFIKEYDNIYVLSMVEKHGYCITYNRFMEDFQEHFYLSKIGHINEGIYLRGVDFPIRIRTFCKGDKIVTSGGTKKVSRLFMDNKIPKKQRDIWPIVERFDGTIILIPHIAKNIAYLYTKPNVFVVKCKELRSEIDA